MRTLFKPQSARDKAERIYAPEVLLTLKTTVSHSEVEWVLQLIRMRNPWRNQMYLAYTVRPYGDYVYEREYDFKWSEEKSCFCLGGGRHGSPSELLPLRRSQLIAFEKWVQELTSELTKLIPREFNTAAQDVKAEIIYRRVVTPS